MTADELATQGATMLLIRSPHVKGWSTCGSIPLEYFTCGNNFERLNGEYTTNTEAEISDLTSINNDEVKDKGYVSLPL